MLRYPSTLSWFFVIAVISIGDVVGQAPPDNRPKELRQTFQDDDANKDGEPTLHSVQAGRQKTSAEKGKQFNDLPTPTHADVKYGPAARNVLDFYQAPSTKPTPLIINIHGGGFVLGDKRGGIRAAALKTIEQAGISFASINYRFVDGNETIFPAPQHDGARAIQFLRSKATEWNIDKNRIACMGSSAGAGISMWIGFHDDLADPKSEDPVLRESTRIQAIGTFGGQGTYNPIEIKSLIGGRAWEHPSIFKFYGATTTEELLNPTPERRKLYEESSAVTHLTKDDPPLYMIYDEADGPLPVNAKPGQGIHHPNFGRQLKKKMDEMGIENVFVNVPEAKVRNPAAEMLQFFVKHLEAVPK